jgi:hypothetical protein
LSQLPIQTIYVGESCEAALPDYREAVIARDNCGITSLLQSPLPGTMLDANNPYVSVTIVATDISNNKSSVNIDVVIVDTTPPIMEVDTSLLSYTWEKRFGLLTAFQSSIRAYIPDSIWDSHYLAMFSSAEGRHAGGWYPDSLPMIQLTKGNINTLGWEDYTFVMDPSLMVSLPYTIDAGSPTDDWYMMLAGGRDAHPELDLPEMYQSERFGTFSYRIPVGVGVFNVELHFAEIYWDEPGERIFSVSMEGEPIPTLQQFDIVAMVGALNTVVYDFDVTVYDGWLDLEFTASVDYAKISGIVIKEVPLLSIIN